MAEDYKLPHLIYTVLGDGKNGVLGCYSKIGMTPGNGRMVHGEPLWGQYINLGSEQCKTIGQILHETLHSLGKVYILISH